MERNIPGVGERSQKVSMDLHTEPSRQNSDDVHGITHFNPPTGDKFDQGKEHFTHSTQKPDLLPVGVHWTPKVLVPPQDKTSITIHEPWFHAPGGDLIFAQSRDHLDIPDVLDKTQALLSKPETGKDEKLLGALNEKLSDLLSKMGPGDQIRSWLGLGHYSQVRNLKKQLERTSILASSNLEGLVQEMKPSETQKIVETFETILSAPKTNENGMLLKNMHVKLSDALSEMGVLDWIKSWFGLGNYAQMKGMEKEVRNRWINYLVKNGEYDQAQEQIQAMLKKSPQDTDLVFIEKKIKGYRALQLGGHADTGWSTQARGERLHTPSILEESSLGTVAPSSGGDLATSSQMKQDIHQALQGLLDSLKQKGGLSEELFKGLSRDMQVFMQSARVDEREFGRFYRSLAGVLHPDRNEKASAEEFNTLGRIKDWVDNLHSSQWQGQLEADTPLLHLKNEPENRDLHVPRPLSFEVPAPAFVAQPVGTPTPMVAQEAHPEVAGPFEPSSDTSMQGGEQGGLTSQSLPPPKTPTRIRQASHTAIDPAQGIEDWVTPSARILIGEKLKNIQKKRAELWALELKAGIQGSDTQAVNDVEEIFNFFHALPTKKADAIEAHIDFKYNEILSKIEGLSNKKNR